MFFSILIPAYNCEKYIDECIRSIMNQKCYDFELIIANDGSKDRTADKCKAWRDKYPHQIRYISKDNTGAYLTRRRLLREAKGEYVLFIDADDKYISSETLSHIKKVIEETEADLVFFDATTDVESRIKMFNYSYENGKIFEGDQVAELYRLFVNTKKFQHLWNKAFKRSLVDYDEPDEPFKFRMLRDGVYQIVPILSKVDKAAYLDEVLYYYRTDNEQSVSHGFKIDFYYSMIALHQRILDCSKDWKHKNDETADYVKAGCTTDMCISAIKARDLPENTSINRKQYIKMIGEEPLFRKQYTLKHLANYRKPIAWALFYKQYWMVYLASSFVGVVKQFINRG